MGQYVGIDLHRRSTTIHRMTEDGETLGVEKILSQPFELAQAIAAAGPEPEVVLESTYGWYWAADVLKDAGAHVHLAHALGNNWGNRRVKNDKHDAQDLALLLRIGRLSEGWIAPPEIRELRELVRYRHSLGRHRTSAKAQIHGVMAKNGILPVVAELWGPIGQAQLDGLELPEAYALRMRSLRELLAHIEREITKIDAQLHHRLKSDPGYQALVRLPGVGKVLGAVFVAEIGDISRFPSARKLASWAGLTPTVRGSDRTVRHGHISKQDSAWLRWVLNQAAQTAKRSPEFAASYAAIAKRRGKKIATIAIARKLLTRAWHLLSDMQATGPAMPPRP